MDHKVALSFEDGVTKFITCAEDQSVADAAYRARINIPVDCNDGACGTCKAFCESGTFDPGRYVDDALTADEFAKGFCLPCQIKPKSDLVLQIRSTSDVAKTATSTYTGTVREVTRLSSTVVRLSIEVPNRDALVYLPGQYVNISIPGTNETRSYSFATAPTDGPLDFLIKLVPGGAMSTWLSERAQVGDKVEFTGPHGSFFLRESDRPALLLAGGTGLAPILAIMRAMKASGTTRQVHLVYGATFDEDVVELDTIEALASQLPNLTWDYCVADKETKAKHQGYVTALIEDEHLHDGDVAVYLCGPPPMVEAVRTWLDDKGVEPSAFYYEKFTPAAKVAAVEPVQQETAPAAAPQAKPAAPTPAPARTAHFVIAEPAAERRRIAGQDVFPSLEGQDAPGTGPLRLAPADAELLRSVAGDHPFPGQLDGNVTPLAADRAVLAPGATRTLAGQEIFSASEDLAPLVKNTGPKPMGIHPGRFNDKVVIVTGSAQGIGEAVARRIAAEGGRMVLADRSDIVEALAEDLRTQGQEASAVMADLETFAGAQSVVDAALAEHGRVDVVINNIGGAIWFKPFEEFTPDQIDAEVRRSLMTTLYSCRAALPALIANGGGTIVNVSSIATGGIYRIPYAAAKGGVNAITRALAVEAAPHNIRVVATAPGGTAAPPRRILRGPQPEGEQEQVWFDAHIEQTLDSALMHRYATLDEQAAPIAFLASDEASYITGSVVPVGGGDLG